MDGVALNTLQGLVDNLLDLLEKDIPLSQDRGAHIRAVQQRDAAAQIRHVLELLDIPKAQE